MEQRIKILQKDCDKATKEGKCTLVYQLHVVSSVGATQVDPNGVLSTHQCCASSVGVSRCTESPSTMVFRFSSDRNSILDSNMSSGGLIFEGKRTVTLELVPQLVRPPFPDLFWSFCELGHWVLEYWVRRLIPLIVRNS